MDYVEILMLIGNIHNKETAKDAKRAINDRYLSGGDGMEALQEYFRRKVTKVFGKDPVHEYISWLFDTIRYYLLYNNGKPISAIRTDEVVRISHIATTGLEDCMVEIEYKDGVKQLKKCDCIKVKEEERV